MIYTFKVDDLNKMSESLRGFTDFLKAESLSDRDAFFCRLVSCELISNVIRHGSEAADFMGEIDGGRVIITVLASSLENVGLNPELPDVFAESGRGMYIIKSVCSGEIERLKGGLRIYYKTGKQ